MDDLTPGPIIDAHSRADAIAAGDLVAAPAELVRDAGLRCPVALTAAVWTDCVAWTEQDREETGAIQDETGRLFDVLIMSRAALAGVTGHQAIARVHRIPRGERFDEDLAEYLPDVHLLVTIAPGDDGAPCITISMPGEVD